MKKLLTLETYLAAHDFLVDVTNFHRKLEEQLSAIRPLDFPPREKILELVKDGVPLLQRENFQRQVLDVAEKFLPRELAEPLTRKIFWMTVDKLVPDELKLWQRDEWQKNYCPICGRRPVMAQLKKFNEGRARYLMCGGCRFQNAPRRLSRM